jgi:hypothetical protein
MTPQSSFMIVAPIRPNRIGALRELLATMNLKPGVANPDNGLVPFGRFENLHFARFVVLDDQTTGDIETLYGVHRPTPPIYLAFLGDFDGSYDSFLDSLVERAASGLRRIFAFCEGFSQGDDLRRWMAAQERRPATYYCNWVGRTVLQTREEEQLRRALRGYLDRSPAVADREALTVHETLRGFVQKEEAAGNLSLTPTAATPFAFTARHLFDWVLLVLLVVAGVVTLPLTLIPLLLLAWKVRSLEKSDPEMAPPTDPQWAAQLYALEDYGISNQFSAMGTLKPGWVRAFVMASVLWIIDLTARTIYTRGRLARVDTIHFARWVYLDNRTRVYFASNYDGSLESYMDDFINKVGFGLNVVFCNGVGYPRTEWLLLKGSSDEQKFKYFLRRHELPTEVWYDAHAGLTAINLQRNALIRHGLEKTSLTERQAREWVELIR